MSEEIRYLDKMCKIVRMKCSPTRISREQAADGALSFKQKKTVNKIVTMKNEPSTTMSTWVENVLFEV